MKEAVIKMKIVEIKYGINIMPGVGIRLEPNVEDFLVCGIGEVLLSKYPNLCFMGQEEIYGLCHS